MVARFNSALLALSDDRKLPWFGSNFALCCFGYHLLTLIAILALSLHFSKLFSFSTPLLSFCKPVQNFVVFRVSRLSLINQLKPSFFFM